MRYAPLKAYLDTVLPPAQVNSFIEACETLHNAGLDGHDFALEQELHLAEDGDSATTIQSLRNVVIPLMIAVMANFGIELAESTKLEEYTDVLNGLLSLENYGDPVTIIQMCDNGDGPEEALSEILPFVGAYAPGHYTALFVTVNPSLLERIEAICLTQVQEDPGDPAQLQAVRERLTVYSRRSPEELWVIKDIRGGQRLNMPLESYFDEQRHIADFSELSPESLAVQILGYVLASNTPQEKVREVCDNEFDAVYADAQKVTRADVALIKLLTNE